MKMKKLFWILSITLLLILPNIMAATPLDGLFEWLNISWSGDPLSPFLRDTWVQTIGVYSPIDETAVNISQVSGEDAAQLNEEEIHRTKLNNVISKQKYMYGIYKGTLYILFDTIKLLYYVIELRLVIYFLFTLLPEVFFKLRDSFTNWYISRY